MPGLPAICDNGHRYEDRNIFVGGDSSGISVVGTRVGPCPYCGSMGSIVDGTYDVVEGRVIRRIVSEAIRDLSTPSVTVDELQLLRGILEEARDSSATLRDIKEKVESQTPAASGALGWLKSPNGMATAAWLQVIIPTILSLIAILIALKGDQSGAHPEIPQAEVQQIIQETETRIASEHTATSTIPPRATPGPRQQGRPVTSSAGRRQRGHESCACGSRKQFKNCCGRGRG